MSSQEELYKPVRMSATRGCRDCESLLTQKSNSLTPTVTPGKVSWSVVDRTDGSRSPWKVLGDRTSRVFRPPRGKGGFSQGKRVRRYTVPSPTPRGRQGR